MAVKMLTMVCWIVIPWLPVFQRNLLPPSSGSLFFPVLAEVQEPEYCFVVLTVSVFPCPVV